MGHRPTKLKAVSLFANCGAGDIGYRDAGFEFEVIAELEAKRLRVAAMNHSGAIPVEGDLRSTWPAVIDAFRKLNPGGRPDLLAACPPCQGMSSARSGRGYESDAEAGSQDDRNLLVAVIARVVHELKPRFVVVENVPAFLTRKVWHPRAQVPVSAAVLLANSLRGHYRLFPLKMDLADVGVPQHRKRSFLTFIHRDEPCLDELDRLAASPFPRPTHAPDYPGSRGHVSISDALAQHRLERLDSRDAHHAGSGMHAVPVWDARRHTMVSTIPKNSGLGAWHNDRCLSCGNIEEEESAATCSECCEPLPRPIVEDGNGGYRLVSGFRASSYTRMRPDQPASTITTASGNLGSDKTIHPSQSRLLSPLECQILQTIPLTFKWGDTLSRYGYNNVRAMIGEAVPPLFTEKHGKVLAALAKMTCAKLDSIPAMIARGDLRVQGAEDLLRRERDSFSRFRRSVSNTIQ